MSENEIDLNDLDILDKEDKEEFLELLKDPPKLALEICPSEIWTQIISNIEDVQTLTSLSLACPTLRILARQPLLTQMVAVPPLKELHLYTKKELPEVTNDKDIVLKMHKFIDKVIQESEIEPEKWTYNMYEWDGYNESLDERANQEGFRREVGRKGKAKTKSHIEWERNVENKKKLYKRELAKCWAAAGKMFPFSHAENIEWKKRRQDKVKPEENNNESPKSPKEEKENKSLHHSQKQRHQQHQSRSASNSEKPQKAQRRRFYSASHYRNNPESDEWRFSHEMRNQPRQRRPNLGKGEEEFNRTILTNYVTPKHFTSEDYEILSHDVLTALMFKVLNRFDQSDERVLKFQKELNAYQRKLLHNQAEIRGLKSISFGEGDGRFLVIMRQDVQIFR